MMVLPRIARGMIRSGKAVALCLVHHTNVRGADGTYVAFNDLARQRTDHYKVADGFVSIAQLSADDRALLGGEPVV